MPEWQKVYAYCRWHSESRGNAKKPRRPLADMLSTFGQNYPNAILVILTPVAHTPLLASKFRIASVKVKRPNREIKTLEGFLHFSPARIELQLAEKEGSTKQNLQVAPHKSRTTAPTCGIFSADCTEIRSWREVDRKSGSQQRQIVGPLGTAESRRCEYLLL